MEEINVAEMTATLKCKLHPQVCSNSGELINNPQSDTVLQNSNNATSLVTNEGMIVKTESNIVEHEPIKLHVKLQNNTFAHVKHKKKKCKQCKLCNMSFYSKSLFELHLKKHAQVDRALVKLVRLSDTTTSLKKASKVYARKKTLVESDQFNVSLFSPVNHSENTGYANHPSNGEHHALDASLETFLGTETEPAEPILPKLSFSPTHSSEPDQKISETPKCSVPSATSSPYTKMPDNHQAPECSAPTVPSGSVNHASHKLESISGKTNQDTSSTSESTTKNLFTELNRHLTEVAKTIIKNSARAGDSFLRAFDDIKSSTGTSTSNASKPATNITCQSVPAIPVSLSSSLNKTPAVDTATKVVNLAARPSTSQPSSGSCSSSGNSNINCSSNISATSTITQPSSSISDAQSSSTNQIEQAGAGHSLFASNTNTGLSSATKKEVIVTHGPSRIELLNQNQQIVDAQQLCQKPFGNTDQNNCETVTSSKASTATNPPSNQICHVSPGKFKPLSSGVNTNNNSSNNNVDVSQNSSVKNNPYCRPASPLSHLNATAINNSVFRLNQYPQSSVTRPSSVMILDPPFQTEREPGLPSIQNVMSLAPGNNSSVCGDVTISRSTLRVPHVYENRNSRCTCVLCRDIMNGDLLSKSEMLMDNGRYRYVCPGCRKCFVHRTLLIRHCRTAKHAFMCNTCSSGFLDKIGLECHQKYIHQPNSQACAVGENLQQPSTSQVVSHAHLQPRNTNRNSNVYSALKPSTPAVSCANQNRSVGGPICSTRVQPVKRVRKQDLNYHQNIQPVDDEVVIIGVGRGSGQCSLSPNQQLPRHRPAILSKSRLVQSRAPGPTPPPKRVRFSQPMTTSNEAKGCTSLSKGSHRQQPQPQPHPHPSQSKLAHILYNSEITLTPIKCAPARGTTEVPNSIHPRYQPRLATNLCVINSNSASTIQNQRPGNHEILTRPSNERHYIRPAPSNTLVRSAPTVAPLQQPIANPLGRSSATSTMIPSNTVTSSVTSVGGPAGQSRTAYRVHPVMTPMNTDSGTSVVKLNINDTTNQVLPKWHHPVSSSVTSISNSHGCSGGLMTTAFSGGTHMAVSHPSYSARMPLAAQNNGSRWYNSGSSRSVSGTGAPPPNDLRQPYLPTKLGGANSAQMHSSPGELIGCPAVLWGNPSQPRTVSQITPRFSNDRLPTVNTGSNTRNMVSIKCNACDMTFPTQVAYQEHVQVMHAPQYSCQRQHFANNQVPVHNANSTSQKVLCVKCNKEVLKNEIATHYSHFHSLGTSATVPPVSLSSAAPSMTAVNRTSVAVHVPDNTNGSHANRFHYSGIGVQSNSVVAESQSFVRSQTGSNIRLPPPPSYAESRAMIGSCGQLTTLNPHSPVVNTVDAQSLRTAVITSSVGIPTPAANDSCSAKSENQDPTSSMRSTSTVEPDVIILRSTTNESPSTEMRSQDKGTQSTPSTNIGLSQNSDDHGLDTVVAEVPLVATDTTLNVTRSVLPGQPDVESARTTSIDPSSIFCPDIFSEIDKTCEDGGIASTKEWNVADLESFLLGQDEFLGKRSTSQASANNRDDQTTTPQKSCDVTNATDCSDSVKQIEKDSANDMQVDDTKTPKELLLDVVAVKLSDVPPTTLSERVISEVGEKMEENEIKSSMSCEVNTVECSPAVVEEEVEEEAVKEPKDRQEIDTSNSENGESMKDTSASTGDIELCENVSDADLDSSMIPIKDGDGVVNDVTGESRSLKYFTSKYPSSDWIRRCRLAKARRFRRVLRLCPICDQRFPTRLELIKHLKIHQEYFDHKCRYCGTSFETRKMLANHICSSHESTMGLPRLYRQRKRLRFGSPPCETSSEDPSKLVVAILNKDRVEANIGFWQRMGVVGLITLDSLHAYFNQGQSDETAKSVEDNLEHVSGDV